MRKETIFRSAIVMEWVILIASIPAAILLMDSLPEPLYEYAMREEPFVPLDFVDLAALVLSIFATFGLFFYRRWARPMYLLTTVWLSVSVAFGDPYVYPVLVDTLSEISLLAAGFVIAMSYFGGLTRFDA